MSEIHIHDVARWLYDHAAPVGLVAGGAVGAIIWAWRQYARQFATTEAVERLEDENRRQHEMITKEINSNHIEVMRTLLDIEKRE